MQLLDHDEAAWVEAIGVFERRIKERFLTCIDALIAADTKPDLKPLASTAEALSVPGFSIMALCCLLVETLRRFSRKDHNRWLAESVYLSDWVVH